jgi:hypothetical protein
MLVDIFQGQYFKLQAEREYKNTPRKIKYWNQSEPSAAQRDCAILTLKQHKIEFRLANAQRRKSLCDKH